MTVSNVNYLLYDDMDSRGLSEKSSASKLTQDKLTQISFIKIKW